MSVGYERLHWTCLLQIQVAVLLGETLLKKSPRKCSRIVSEYLLSCNLAHHTACFVWKFFSFVTYGFCDCILNTDLCNIFLFEFYLTPYSVWGRGAICLNFIYTSAHHIIMIFLLPLLSLYPSHISFVRTYCFVSFPFFYLSSASPHITTINKIALPGIRNVSWECVH